jgi:hypothetical protein
MFEQVVWQGLQPSRLGSSCRCKFFLACIIHKLEQDLMGQSGGEIQMDCIEN